MICTAPLTAAWTTGIQSAQRERCSSGLGFTPIGRSPFWLTRKCSVVRRPRPAHVTLTETCSPTGNLPDSGEKTADLTWRVRFVYASHINAIFERSLSISERDFDYSRLPYILGDRRYRGLESPDSGHQPIALFVRIRMDGKWCRSSKDEHCLSLVAFLRNHWFMCKLLATGWAGLGLFGRSRLPHLQASESQGCDLPAS
jgi:hypothetical protein